MKIIFIHGAGSSHLDWIHLKKAFKNALALDLPGHYKNNSQKPEKLEDYSIYLKNFIDENTILVGHSMGGVIAYHSATLYQVKSIILVNTSFFNEYPIKLDKETICERMYYEEEFIRRCKERNYLLFNQMEVLKNDLELLAKFKFENYLKIFKQKNIPTFHIIGLNDKLVGLNNLLKTSQILNAHNYFIEKCGHIPHIEKQKDFLKILNSILFQFDF